ncbi:MAG: TldD/PmbA family protein [Candidatus Thorarchaeota archaeon]
MVDDVLSLIRPLVSVAEKEGADEVEIFAQTRHQKIVSFENNALRTAMSSIVEGIGIRVLVNKSLGFASVNSYDRERILEGLQNAISIARVTPPEDHYYLPESRKISVLKDIYDDSVADLSMIEIIEYGKHLLKCISDFDSRISVDSGEFSSSVDEYAIATSNGIESNEKKSLLNWFSLGWAIDGTDIGIMEYEYDSVVSPADLDIEAGAKMFGQRAIQNLSAEKTEGFKGSAIFSPEAVQDLISMLTRSTNALTIQSGSSFLQDKLGENIAVSDLTITDDGKAAKSTASSSFDREGVPRTSLDIVESGVFKGVLYNAFTANKDGLESTGHASGGFRAAPNISGTNIEVQSGNVKLDDMVSEIDHGIFIQRISMSPDITSGNFSGVLKGGRLIENGELKMTLKEITVAGNLYECLKKITGISKEQKALRGPTSSWLVPYMRIDDLDFST